MKFYGEPNLAVYKIQKKKIFGDVSHRHRVFICQFDENGEFETDDEKLIAQLINKFEHELTTPETDVETKLRHCKKCDFTCETQGQLLKHYREAHSKEVNDECP